MSAASKDVGLNVTEEVREVAIPCRITRSGFPNERVFRITLPDGSEFVGAAPAYYFWNSDRSKLGENQPSKRGESIPGFVEARIITSDPDSALVSLPSGNVVEISPAEITTISEKPSNVSVKS